MNILRYHIDVYEYKENNKDKDEFNMDFSPYYPIDLNMKAGTLSILSFILKDFSDDMLKLIMDMIELGFRKNKSGTTPKCQIFIKSLTCDRKFKENIKPIDYIECKLDKRVLFYEWEWNSFAQRLFGFKGKGIGLIAQQVVKYYPYLVEQHEIVIDDQCYQYAMIDLSTLIQQLGIKWY